MAQTSFPLEVGGFHPSPRPDFWPVPSARAPHGPAIPVPSIPQTCPFPSSGRPGSPALPPLAEYQPLPTPFSALLPPPLSNELPFLHGHPGAAPPPLGSPRAGAGSQHCTLLLCVSISFFFPHWTEPWASSPRARAAGAGREMGQPPARGVLPSLSSFIHSLWVSSGPGLGLWPRVGWGGGCGGQRVAKFLQGWATEVRPGRAGTADKWPSCSRGLQLMIPHL